MTSIFCSFSSLFVVVIVSIFGEEDEDCCKSFTGEIEDESELTADDEALETSESVEYVDDDVVVVVVCLFKSVMFCSRMFFICLVKFLFESFRSVPLFTYFIELC